MPIEADIKIQLLPECCLPELLMCRAQNHQKILCCQRGIRVATRSQQAGGGFKQKHFRLSLLSWKQQARNIGPVYAWGRRQQKKTCRVFCNSPGKSYTRRQQTQSPDTGRNLKGVSHEIFKFIFWHVCIGLGQYKNL